MPAKLSEGPGAGNAALGELAPGDELPAAVANALRAEVMRLARVPEPLQMGPAGVELVIRLRALPAHGVNLLVAMLDDATGLERVFAARLLAHFDDTRAVAALFDLTHDPDPRVAATASQSLALMETSDAVESLRALAREPNGLATQLNAICGLCKHGVADGLALARDYLDKLDNPVSARVLLAANLALIQSPKLFALIEHIAESFARVPEVMSAVVSYYQSLDTPEARQRLKSLIKDERIESGVRRLASRPDDVAN